MRTGLLALAAALEVVDEDDELELPLDPHAATVSAAASTASAAPALRGRRTLREMCTSLLLLGLGTGPGANLHNRHCLCQVRTDEPAATSPATSACSFAKAASRGRYFMPQSGAATSCSASL